jgi:hypothetical protein
MNAEVIHGLVDNSVESLLDEIGYLYIMLELAKSKTDFLKIRRILSTLYKKILSLRYHCTSLEFSELILSYNALFCDYNMYMKVVLLNQLERVKCNRLWNELHFHLQKISLQINIIKRQTSCFGLRM